MAGTAADNMKGQSGQRPFSISRSSSFIIMIRKTNHIKKLVRNNHGHLDVANEYITIDDILAKLDKYEEMEMHGTVMEVHDAYWIRSGYNDRFKCTHCGSVTQVAIIDGQPAYKFCPYCNARMKGRKYI